MKERGFFLLGIILIFAIYNVNCVLANNVTTELDVTNSPPILLSDIPNQSWQTNENLVGAFDLDDYFIDPNGDNITFYYSSVENVTVVVDSNNSVSFYPDANLTAVRTITFYASDGYNNGTSNLVYLNIGTDVEAPRWSNPAKTRETIYQNSYVNFTTVWTDNFQLRDYLFFIGHGVGSNTSYYNFSGTYNISNYQVQISFSAGTVVYWYFCARDTNFNLNCSDRQNFTISEQVTSSTSSTSTSSSGTGTGGTSTVGGAAGSFASIFGGKKETLNYSVDPTDFLISLKQGSVETRVLRITNLGNQNLSFELKLECINDFVVLSEKSFIVEVGETKSVTVDFSSKEEDLVDQYNGKIVINSSAGIVSVPIVIDINALEFEFEVEVNVSGKSKRANPGDIIYSTISIYNLKDIPFSEVDLYYAIKDYYGVVYDSGEESFLLEDEVHLNRNLTLSRDSPVGNYIFYARVSHKNFTAIDSDPFESGAGFDFGAFFKFTFFIILIIILSVFAIVLFLRYRTQREKERLLSLYLMLTQMKELVADKKIDRAIDLFIRIKSIYGEPVSKTAVDNKAKLKEELIKLSERLEKEVSQTSEQTQNEIKQAAEKKENLDKIEKEGVAGEKEKKSDENVGDKENTKNEEKNEKE